MGDMDLRVVFMGSPDFALPTLNALYLRFQLVGVVTQPDRPAGRGRSLHPPDVKIRADELGLPFIQPNSLSEPGVIDQLHQWSPDVIVVAAFGQILKRDVLNLPKFGCVNVHASLLPRWRGAAPVQAAILNDDLTGVTIMKMDEGLDTGPIIRQRTMPISDEMHAGELFEILSHIGADLLVETLPEYARGEIQLQKQDDQKATYAQRLKKADGKLDLTQPANFLLRKIRAYYPWPGAYHFFEGKRLKIIKAHVEISLDGVPEKRYVIEEKPAWGTGKDLLVLDQVQVAGKTPVSGEAFLRGASHWLEN